MRMKRLLTLLGSLLLFSFITRGAVVITKTQLNAVFGSDGLGKIVYTKKADGYAYFIDFSASILTEKKLCSVEAHSPMISPDGKSVAFWAGTGISSGSDCNTNTGTMYLCQLKENASTVSFGPGFNPRWWTDPANGNTYIVYHTKGCKVNYPQPGETRKQQINPTTYAKIGSSVRLLDKSFNGGLSKNGRYLCTAYNKVYIYDLASPANYNLYGGGQACNASISPADDPAKQDRMMHLNLPHTTFSVRNHTDTKIWEITNPPGTDEWQTPEWSTHENYCSATAKKDGTYDVYLVRMSDKKICKVVTGDYSVPHVWVPGTPSQPDMNLSPAGLEFFAQPGGGDPNDQTVTVTAVGGHSLTGLNVTGDGGWLGVSISGSGDSRTLTNQVTIGSLAEGNYSKTVTVTAGTLSKDYRVTLTVSTGWSDTFNDGDATGWQTGGGNWTVTGGQYQNSSSGRTESFGGDANWTDITYECDITPVTGTDVWVIFRVQDASNYYLYTLQSSKLYKLVNGSYTQLASGSGSYSTGTQYHIKVVLQGPSITIYADGTEVLQYSDGTFSKGMVGFGSNNAQGKFDNVLVTGFTGILDDGYKNGDFKLVVSPCPMTDVSGMTIRIEGHPVQNTDIQLFESDGDRLPARFERAAGINEYYGNLKGLPAGVYLLKVYIKNGGLNRKVVITR